MRMDAAGKQPLLTQEMQLLIFAPEAIQRLQHTEILETFIYAVADESPPSQWSS